MTDLYCKSPSGRIFKKVTVGICLIGCVLGVDRLFNILSSPEQISEAQPRSLFSNDTKMRPVMHTFYEDIGKQDTLLNPWNNSWHVAGWDTRILSSKDAQAHEKYSVINKLFDSVRITEYNKLCFLRWLAMAQTVQDEIGWMSDYDTFALKLRPGDRLTDNANDGQFTSYNEHVPNLLSGSKKEWNRMVDLLIDTWPSHTGMYTDMMVLLTALRKHKDKAARVYKYSVDGYHSEKIDVVDCFKYRQAAVIHFSHKSMTETFLGGWLEAEIKKDQEENATIEFQNEDGTLIYHEGGMYRNFPSDEWNCHIFINGEFAGDVYDSMINKYRGRTSMEFLTRVRDDCIVGKYQIGTH